MWSVPRVFFKMKKYSKVCKLWGKNQKSPYLDNEYIERDCQSKVGSLKVSTLLAELYPNLAHSSCGLSPVHSLDKIEKKRKEP